MAPTLTVMRIDLYTIGVIVFGTLPIALCALAMLWQ
jgi:hypothetical protein